MAQANGGCASSAEEAAAEELVGRIVRKEFPFGFLEGKVVFSHRPDGEALLLRVEYTDGDSEDLPEDEARDLVVPLSSSSSPLSSRHAAAGVDGASSSSGTAIVTPPTPFPRGSTAAAAAIQGGGFSGAKGRSGRLHSGSSRSSSRRDASSSAAVAAVKKGASSSKKDQRRDSSTRHGGGRKKGAAANGVAAGEGGGVVTPTTASRRNQAGRVEDDQGMVGKDVWKTFSGELYHGKVSHAHVLVSNSEVLYRVVYDDGDEEDMDLDDLIQLIPQRQRQQQQQEEEEEEEEGDGGSTRMMSGGMVTPVAAAAPRLRAISATSKRPPSSAVILMKKRKRDKNAKSVVVGKGKGDVELAGEGGQEDGAGVEKTSPGSPASKFNDFMDGLIMAYEARGMERRKSRQFDGTDEAEAAASASSTPVPGGGSGGRGGAPGLLRREVSRAYTAVATAGEAVSESSVDALGLLLRLMEEQVRQGLAVDILPLAATCSGGQGIGRWGQEGPEALAAVDSSLEACLVCLMIVTCPGLDRKLCSDELIDHCLGLFRHHLARHIAPVLDPALATSVANRDRGSTSGDGDAEFSHAEAKIKRSKGNGKAAAQQKKVQKAAARGGSGDDSDNSDDDVDDSRLERRLREISKKLVSGGTLGKAYEVLGLLDLLVSRVRLEDNVVLQLCNACKSCLVLEAPSSSADKRGEGASRLQPLQHGALGVLQTVSRKYVTFRSLLIEDVFGLLLKMPTARRQLRTFRIAHVPDAIGGANGGTDGYIQNLSALVMLMVQSCVTSPPLVAAAVVQVVEAEEEGAGSKADRRRRQQRRQQEQQQSGLNPARNAATYFVSRFLTRCSAKEDSATFQHLLANVVDDLLATVLLPEWPAAELLLHALCGALVKDLKDQKAGGGGGARDQQYCLMAMDVLGRVACGLADITRRERECPMILPEAAEARKGGEPGDKEERVRCVCGGAGRGTGDGEEGGVMKEGGVMMVDCDRCHRWFHGHCVGIYSQEDCPEEWFCVDCTILRQVSAQKQAHAKRQRVDDDDNSVSKKQNLSRELGVEAEGDHERDGGSGRRDGVSQAAVSDLDVFRQLVLNRLTAASGASRSAQRSAGSAANGSDFGSSSSSRHGRPSAASTTPSAAIRRGGNVRSSREEGGEAERGWGWQARQTQLALWIEEARKGGGGDGGGAAAHLLGQWKSDCGCGSWDALTLAHDGTLRLCRRLLVERDLCKKGLDAILAYLLALLRDPSTSLRARAVKRLAGVVDADGSLMSREVVRLSVTSSFLDEAVSVRQAAVDLVGKYILADKAGGGARGGASGATLLDTYYGALMDRLLDKGVSVRKSVVRTLRGVLLWRSSHPRHTVICRALVERAVVVREEDTIRDLIRDTFQEIWFSEEDADTPQASSTPSPPSGTTSAAGTATASSLMTLNPSSKGRNGSRGSGAAAAAAAQSAAASMGVTAVAVQVMEVVYGVKENTWLVKLLRGMICGPGAGDKEKKDRSKKREASLRRCKALVQALVSVQLGLDEGVSAVPPGTGSPLEDLPQQLLACVATLGVLCRASPSLLAPHLHALLPYLKGENGLTAAEESEICRQVSDMVYEALPLLKNPDLVQMTELADDLVRLAYRFGSAVVHASLRCLARLVRLVTHDPEPLLGLLQSFYSSLYRYRNDVQQPQLSAELTIKVRHNLLRGLVVSGCICRFYAFGANNGDDGLQYLGDGSLAGTGGRVCLAEQVTEQGARLEVFQMLRLYLTRARGADIRSKALQGLGQLLIGAPRLMLLADEHGLVGAALAQGAGDEVLVQALRCYKDILEAEEDRVETGLARDDMEATGVTVAQRVQGDQDGESSVVGGVLQMHLTAVLSRLFHRNRVVRAAAISLLGVMLRQGLVNPVDVVPQLLALGGDSAAFVRGEAFRLLTVEDSKNGEFIRTRLLDGLFMAYTFQQRVLCDWRPLLPSTDPAAGGTGGGCSIVGPAYTLCVRPQRPSRYSCLRMLLSLFSEGKAWELASFVASSEEKVGVSSGGGSSNSCDSAPGDGGSSPGIRATETPPPAKRARNSHFICSLGTNKKGGGFRAKTRLTGPLDMRALSFVCCTLAGLPFQVQEEPLFVVDYVNRQMSLQGSQCLELLHTLLARKGVATPPPDSDDIDEDEMKLHAAGRTLPSVPAPTSSTPEKNDGGENGDLRTPSRSATAPEAVGGGGAASAGMMGWEIASLEVTKAEEDSMMHLRRACSAAAAFSMLLRLKVYLKSAYGLTSARCQAYRPNETTKAIEKPAQAPSPPPETFNPFKTPKKGAGKNVVDPASLAAAAAAAAEVLDKGSPQELSNFYLELRGLAQDDPADYATWECLEEVADGGQDVGGGEIDAGSGSDDSMSKKRGKKRALACSTGGSAGGRGRKRRASAGDALPTAKTKRGSGGGGGGGGGGRGKAAKVKGKKSKPVGRRGSTGGSAALSESSDRHDDEDDGDEDDEDWA